ncbi:MAG: nucleoside deaminase, partial [Dehalococcoidia bacterium]
KTNTTLSPHPDHPHDRFVIETVREAIASAKEGNFGVGAVLVDSAGKILFRGRNRIFFPFFRSDLHAEMDLMTKVEERFQDVAMPSDLALFSSLEPCPMCTTRLIISGVGQVYYAAPDEPGGMVTRLSLLPSEWQVLAEGRQFRQADCSAEVRELAWRIFEITVGVNDQRLKERVKSLLGRNL